MDLPVSMIEGRASFLVLTAWGGRTWAWQRVERPLLVLIAWDGRTRAWLWRRKIERPPLILIVLGGRTRAHLDDPSPWVVEWHPPLGQDKLTVEVKNHNALWTASAPFECYRTDLVLVLLRHGRLVDRIEENQKMVIVGVRLVCKFLPTMTLYCTIILDYCRVQLKKLKNKIQKKSRVGACWSRRFFMTFDMCRLITSA